MGAAPVPLERRPQAASAGAGGAGGNGGDGGAGGASGAGGGGLGAGGAIFVASGGVLTYGGGSVTQNTSAGGKGGLGTSGGEDGDDGQGYGAGIFIMGDENIAFDPGAGKTLTIANQISDQSGSDPFDTYGDPGVGGIIVEGAGTVQLSDDNAFFGNAEIDSGTLLLSSGVAAGYGEITFGAATANAVLEFTKAYAPANTIEHFQQGDEIKIDGFLATSKNYDGASLMLGSADGNVTIKIPGVASTNDFTVTTEDGDTIITTDTAPCYARGTMILTDLGDKAVEALAIGDRVMTCSGELRPIRWIGRRRLDLRNHPRPQEVWPVRVAKGAFGDGLPRRDLWLSPGHNVVSEGVLTPISALINGISIAQIPGDRVEYWHVELDAHDIIFAEGLPAESYLDCGNRHGFANSDGFVEAHPDFATKHWAQTCLPLVNQGPLVARAKVGLLARLRQEGHRIVSDANAFVVVDGSRRRAGSFVRNAARLRASRGRARHRVALKCICPLAHRC